MDRPGRTRKPVDYSQFENDDEDFTFASAPPSKKLRVKDVQTKKEKKEKPPKKAQKAVPERIPLDDKLYQRDLEVALALSVQETSVEVHTSPSIGTCTDTETDDVDHVPLLSNCSVDSNLLELDKITEGADNELGTRCRRLAASKALSDQRKMLIDDSGDEEKVDDYKPNFASDGESESESNVSDDEEIEFALKKSKKSKLTKKTEPKMKETKPRVSSENAKKSPKSKFSAAATPASSTSTIGIKSQPVLKTSVSPKSVGSPLQVKSPQVGVKKQSWTPPSQSGNCSNALGGVSVKSPNQGLRLGLSRFARVKPLHPSVANS